MDIEVIGQDSKAVKAVKDKIEKDFQDKIILFHGGCYGCTQQIESSADFCIDCCYFQPNWDLPSLNNRPLSESELARNEIKERLNI